VNKKIEIDPRDVTGRPATVESVKLQAKASGAYLKEQGFEVSHSQCLELMARAHGYEDWNTASAMMKRRQEFFERRFRKAVSMSDTEKYAQMMDGDMYATKNMIVANQWQKLSESTVVKPGGSEVLLVYPKISPYFEPQAARIYAYMKSDPSKNARFTVSAVEIGKSPQEAVHWPRAEVAELGIIGDIFSRGKDPALVNWAVFSTKGLARELEVHVNNLHRGECDEIVVHLVVWGRPVVSLDSFF